MPKLYLSPSLQEYNLFLDGTTEEENMNRIADAMEPYLEASGIEYVRNSPDMTLTEVLEQSRAENVDFHLALHSNAAPIPFAGKLMGTDVYYFDGSYYGKRGAEIIAENFKEIYPEEELVKAVPTKTLRELRRTTAPSALIEVGYHDNPQDAQWIQENTREIGRNLVIALTEYFGIPFVDVQR